ncbi:MAG: helix-turn-helix domain-containing protein [Bacteroidales bacterium]|nr:helix-turn-helix domain-containing protein [Bacteroidales bacterium]
MRVKELLKQRGMTAKELASRLGMTETGLSIALSDRGNPTLARLRQIADVLGVSVADLFAEPPGDVAVCPHCGQPVRVSVKLS